MCIQKGEHRGHEDGINTKRYPVQNSNSSQIYQALSLSLSFFFLLPFFLSKPIVVLRIRLLGWYNNEQANKATRHKNQAQKDRPAMLLAYSPTNIHMWRARRRRGEGGGRREEGGGRRRGERREQREWKRGGRDERVRLHTCVSYVYQPNKPTGELLLNSEMVACCILCRLLCYIIREYRRPHIQGASRE